MTRRRRYIADTEFRRVLALAREAMTREIGGVKFPREIAGVEFRPDGTVRLFDSSGLRALSGGAGGVLGDVANALDAYESGEHHEPAGRP